MSTSHESGIHPTGSSSETVDKLKDEVSQVSQAGSDAAKDVAESRYEQGRDVASEQLDTASEAISEAAAKLKENDSPFASYASELSVQLSSFSDKLSTSSIDDLVSGARTLARDNPAAFMLGSMAIGLAASRFFKATGEQVSQQTNTSTGYQTSTSSAYSGTGSNDSRTGMSYDDHRTHSSNTISQSATDLRNTSTTAGVRDSAITDRGALDRQDAYSATDSQGTSSVTDSYTSNQDTQATNTPSDASVGDRNISSNTADEKSASGYTNRTTSEEV